VPPQPPDFPASDGPRDQAGSSEFGAGPPEDGGEQEQPGLGARQQRVAALLTRLATTARSFLLYEAGNEAIHRFLTQLLESITATLDDEGILELDVQPFELKFRGQTVYLNRDRERSLAFRLYRDGVRRLTFVKSFDWEELARLIEVLSIRYTRVHQREDDMVTLLWKARFAHLEIAAVEGIVPDEGEQTRASGVASAAAFSLPEDVDLPRPSLPSPVGPTWTTVPEERLAALRAEAAAAALPADCMVLLARLRQQLNDPKDPLTFGEIAHLFAETRDFLMTEDQLGTLRSLVALLWEMAAEPEPAWDPRRHAALYELLDTCGDRRAVRRLLRSVPAEERVLRPELIEVLSRACPDPLAAVMDVLADEQSPAIRAVARQLLEHYGTRKRDQIQERFQQCAGVMAADLLRVIAGIGGEGAASFVARQAAHTDAAVQDEALWQLANMPYSGPVGHALFDAFRLSSAVRRGKVLDLIVATRDPRFVDLLAAHVEEHASGITTDEAARLGQVLGALGGESSIPRWQQWLKPAGRLRSGFEGPLPRQIVAALALSEIPGEAAAEALGVAFDSANDESQPWILGALAQRQRQRTKKAP
jgi:hypothetical protein